MIELEYDFFFFYRFGYYQIMNKTDLLQTITQNFMIFEWNIISVVIVSVNIYFFSFEWLNFNCY